MCMYIYFLYGLRGGAYYVHILAAAVCVSVCLFVCCSVSVSLCSMSPC